MRVSIAILLCFVQNMPMSSLPHFRSNSPPQSHVIILISITTTIGLYELSDEIILLKSGRTYIEASSSLKILSIAFFFAVIGGVLAYCVSVPLKRENVVLKATIVSAVENIMLNLLLIPVLGIDGAAITTLLAEATVFGILLFNLRDKKDLFNWKSIGTNLVKCIIASCLLIPLKHAVDSINLHFVIVIVLYYFISIIAYCLLSVILKNEALKELIHDSYLKILNNDSKEKKSNETL